MKSSSLKTLLVILLGLGIFLFLAGLTYLNFRLAGTLQAGRHFVIPWLAARSWVMEGTSPYDQSVGKRVFDQEKGGNEDVIIEHLGIIIPGERVTLPVRLIAGKDYPQFIYPLPSMLVFAPFGLMDFKIARAVWLTVLEGSLVLLTLTSIRLSRWEPGWIKIVVLLAFSLFWYYGLVMIFDGQLGLLTALFVALSLLFIMQDQDILAGVFLAFAMINPQMVVLLVPFILIWSVSVHRKDIVWSFLVTLSLLVLGFTILIPAWILQWFLILYEITTSFAALNSPLIVIANSMPGVFMPVVVVLYASLLIYLLVEWVLVMGKDEQWFLWTAMMTIVISNLAGYKTGVANYMLFLPVLMIIFKSWEQRWREGGKIFTGFVILLLGGGIWAAILVLRQTFDEPAWIYYPLPLVSLLGLWWVRWWFIRPPQLLIESLVKKVG